MKTLDQTSDKRGRRTSDFPELHVGFPERNDATSPSVEMERVHVDIETLNISRKNASEVTRAFAEGEPAKKK
jgi:hypothetical protein